MQAYPVGQGCPLPFKSLNQRKYMYSKMPGIAAKWEGKTKGKTADLVKDAKDLPPAPKVKKRRPE
jgi:hypothetical protein